MNMNKNKNLTKIFEKYKGMWVALDDSLKKVISSDKNADKVYKAALEKGYKKPTLFKVPQENLPYFGFVKWNRYLVTLRQAYDTAR